MIADMPEHRPPPMGLFVAPGIRESHRTLVDRGMNTDHDADPRSLIEIEPQVIIIPQISQSLSLTAIVAAEDDSRNIKCSSEDDVPNIHVDLGGANKRKEAWAISEEGGAASEACQGSSESKGDPDTLADAREEQIGDFKRLPGKSLQDS